MAAADADGDDQARTGHTFLVADIRGYTAYTSRHGDLAASRLVARFADVVGEACEAWSGRLVELRGDEALGVFDEGADALRAAVELQDALADESAHDPRHPLPVGMGLAEGEAVPLGGGFRGSALNLAARLCARSAAGEIHASAGLIERVGRLAGLTYEPLDELELKGFAEGQQAYLVRALAPATGAARCESRGEQACMRVLPTGLDTTAPLVGREAELRWLGWHWRRARHGHPRLIEVHGPQGMGKTRLVAGLAVRAIRDGAEVHHLTGGDIAGQCRAIVSRAGETACLLIIDPAGPADPAALPFTQGEGTMPAGSPILQVVLRSSPVRPEAWAQGRARPPVLEVGPLELPGIRQLAATIAPSVADELPYGSIRETSGGLPGRASEAIREWAARIGAERVSDPRTAGLPAERSSFVGRASELARARELLASTRLLTLVGPPGTGKTRLALRLAREAGEAYATPPVLVPLAAVRDPRLLGSAIARALGLRESGTTPPMALVRTYLGPRSMLLVLDNFEQLLDAATSVGELLDVAPGLRVVVTSRAALGLSGEQLYPVPPLATPVMGDQPLLAAARHSDAALLFVERATAADPGFELSEENAGDVCRICERLDGLPLAIELAAARVRTLSAAALLEHLGQRLPILTGGPADQSVRHRTMRDAIAWSYELLPEDERSLLRRLAVFRGGFALEEAARVTQVGGLLLLEMIDSLLAKSLLVRLAGPRLRYAMLELIGEFAYDELVVHGEEGEATERHLETFAQLAGELEPVLEGEDVGDATDRLTHEIENLRAALDYAWRAHDIETGLSLAAATWRFWQSIGHLAEGRSRLEQLLATHAGSAAARARAIGALGGLAYWQGDFDLASQCYRQARELHVAAGDQAAEAEAVYSLSLVATYVGDLDAAERHADEAMRLALTLGDERQLDEVMMAQALVAWKRGDLARAMQLTSAGLAISHRLGMHSMAVSQLVGIAGIAYRQGHLREALTRAGEALDLAIAAGNSHTQVFALDSISSFVVTSAPREAVELCSAATALRDAHGGGWTLEVMGIECARTSGAALLDEAELEAATEAGARLDLEAATEAARALLRRMTGASGSA